MKIFIDTANVKEIKAAYDLGIVEGVTTNPSIIAREGKKFEDALKEIDAIVSPETLIFAEVIQMTAEGMVEDAENLQALRQNMIIKIPMCAEGLKAVSILSKKGFRTCVTLCFSAGQALLASNAGATYVAPFLGRVDDIGWNGMDLVSEIADMFAVQGSETQIVAASTRHPVHVIDLAKAGADVATVPYKVIMQMIDHPLTTNGLEKFMKDWATLPQ